jgi:hypothetical protein
MKLVKQILSVIIFLSTFLQAESKDELLFYVGITMVKPVNELAKNFEKTHNCTIKILQINGKICKIHEEKHKIDVKENEKVEK